MRINFRTKLILLRINIFLFILFLVIQAKSAFSQSSIVLTDAAMEYIIPNQKLDFYKSQSSNLGIADILSDSTISFSRSGNDELESLDYQANYWFRFSVFNNTGNDFRWFLEEFNFNADDLFVYYQNETGRFDSLALSGSESFMQRYINHKNLVFPFPVGPSESKIYYLKYKSSVGNPPLLVIREVNSFISHAISEYFLLGIFYGILGLLVLYSIVSFIYFRSRSIGYFSFFVSALGLYFLSYDGIGFQFLWSSWPLLNTVGSSIFMFCSVAGFLLFSVEIVKIRNSFPLISKLIWGFIGLRGLYMILQISLPQIISFPYIDILPVILILIVAVQCWQHNSGISMFFIAGVGFILAAVGIYGLTQLDSLQVNNFAFYSFYMAPLLAVLCFYKAVSESISLLQIKPDVNDLTSEDLDQKVKEKTKELLLNSKVVEDRIKAQDTFIFKVTHDLKGPLRSIVGLVKSARIDKKTAPEVYLDYILKSCERLDTVISDLLTISRTTSKELQFGKVDFKAMIADVVESFKGNVEKENFEVIADFEQQIDFYSENTLLYSVFQNLIENAMNYKNPEAIPNSYLRISIQESNDTTQIQFKDNGIGIPEEFITKIFDMFYRVEEKHSIKSTGLGLYLVKIGLNRLESTVEVQSKVGEGTTFILKLKNFYADVDQEENRKLELV